MDRIFKQLIKLIIIGWMLTISIVITLMYKLKLEGLNLFIMCWIIGIIWGLVQLLLYHYFKPKKELNIMS